MDTKPTCKQYFRGFVGETYRNGQWYPQSEEDYLQWASQKGADAEKLGRQLLGFPGAGTYEGYNPLTNAFSMELLYTDEAGKYAYIPYYTSYAAAETEEKVRLYTDSMAYRDLSVSHLSLYGVQPMDNDPWERGYGYDTYTDPLWNDYCAYVKERDTKITGDGLERLLALADQWKEAGYGVQDGDTSYVMPIQKVVYELTERTEYKKELDAVAFGKDPVENFLFESGEGYCIHYASAAVLLLRRLGVPARYVSGYAVDKSEFEQQPGGSYLAEIRDTAGHVWVEVFFDTLGWLPIEVTKGSSGMIKPAVVTEPEPVKEQESMPQKQQEKQPSKQAVETVEHGNDLKTGLTAAVAAVAALSVSVLLFCYGKKRREQRKRFYSSDTRVAVKEISHVIHDVLQHGAVVPKEELADEEYIKRAAEKLKEYDILKEGEIERFFACAQRCIFSDYRPTKEEAEAGRRLYDKLINFL